MRLHAQGAQGLVIVQQVLQVKRQDCARAIFVNSGDCDCAVPVSQRSCSGLHRRDARGMFFPRIIRLDQQHCASAIIVDATFETATILQPKADPRFILSRHYTVYTAQ